MSSFRYSTKYDVCFRRLAFLGFPSYRVGDDGSVWAFRMKSGWKKLSTRPTGSLYSRRTLCCNGSTKRYYVHQLVLLAFIGPCPNGMECCHNDGIKTNNDLSNLRWGTPKENGEDKIRHGNSLTGRKNPNWDGLLARGEMNGCSKLTESDVRKIRRLYRPRRGLGREGNLKMLAEMFGVGKGTIWGIAHRLSWKHVP